MKAFGTYPLAEATMMLVAAETAVLVLGVAPFPALALGWAAAALVVASAQGWRYPADTGRLGLALLSGLLLFQAGEAWVAGGCHGGVRDLARCAQAVAPQIVTLTALALLDGILRDLSAVGRTLARLGKGAAR